MARRTGVCIKGQIWPNTVLLIFTAVFGVNTFSVAEPGSIRINHLPGFVSSVIVPEVTPQQIFQWLRHMDNGRFRDWHPAHVEYRILRETPDFVGSRIYFNEVISGYEISGNWKVIEANLPESVTFKKLWQPVYWKLTLNSAEEGGTFVRNEMRYGFGCKWVDNILAKIIHRWYLKPEIRTAIDKHDKEEFRMLSDILKSMR